MPWTQYDAPRQGNLDPMQDAGRLASAEPKGEFLTPARESGSSVPSTESGLRRRARGCVRSQKGGSMRYLEAVVLALALVPQVTRGQVVDKCQAGKIKAAGKKTSDKAKCRATALKKGIAIDPLCLTKAEDKFVQSMAKADALGPCPGTPIDVEAAVDQCVTDYVALLTASTTTTTMPGCSGDGGPCGADSDCCSNNCVITNGVGTCQGSVTTTTSSTTTTTAPSKV